MTIKYPTEFKGNGPWLLDENALLELDQILESEWLKLEGIRNNLIDEAAKKEVEELNDKFGTYKTKSAKKKKIDEIKNDNLRFYGLKRSTKKISIMLKNKKYETDRLLSAIQDNALTEEVATAFDADIESGEVKCKVHTSDWSDHLYIDVSPETSREAREIYVVLRNWSEKYSPTIWQKLWNKFHGITWGVWLLMLVIMALFVSINSTSSLTSTYQRARELLDKGITEENSTEAIELLLIMQTNYDPINQVKTSNVSLTPIKVVFWFGLIINILLSPKVKVVLGIGKGRQKINLWKFWYKFVSITIPGFVFVWFVAPYIVNIINSYINNK